MAIIRNSRIAWQGAFGVKDRATNAPVDPSTIFEAASMSKPVFAYAVMKLTGHVDRSICGRYEADLEVCASDIDEYMQTNLLAPFKMDSSGYLGPASGKEHLARGHDADGVPFRAKTPGPVNLERANAARYAAMGGSGPTSKCRTARDTRSSGRSGGEWPTAQQVTGFVILTNGDNGWKLIQQLAPDASQWIHTR